MSQAKPELQCNAVLAQSPDWYATIGRAALKSLLSEGVKKVAEVAQNWRPPVYRLGPTKPEKLTSVDACVAKAVRLQDAVDAALKAGGKTLRGYSHKSQDDAADVAAGGAGKEDL